MKKETKLVITIPIKMWSSKAGEELEKKVPVTLTSIVVCDSIITVGFELEEEVKELLLISGYSCFDDSLELPLDMVNLDKFKKMIERWFLC